MSQVVHLITISVSPPFPDGGMVSMIARVTGQDKDMIDLAAAHMGMTKSQLMRVLLVRGAERILKELGIEMRYEQNTSVDLSRGETLID